MTTTTAPAPAAPVESRTTQPANVGQPPATVPPVATGGLPPLWPRGIQIPFIGVTGEFGVGKTLFGLLIDPERCVHFDFEQSAKTYETGLPFKRIDMADRMLAKFPDKRYRPIDLFVEWRELFLKMPRGQFRVVVIDDVSSLEDGLVEYVQKNPSEFGYTAQQFAKSEGLMWGAVKAFYKQLMLTAGIDCCVMVAHMRDQWAGKAPTGKREAKGKETIFELASLYLMFDRKPDDKGRVPGAPNAVKLKDRLSIFLMNNNTGEYEPKPVLPPRITACTPARIRWYIDNPPDYAKLKKDELAIPEQMTEEQRLLLQAHVAEQQALAANAQAAAQKEMNDGARIRLDAMQRAPGNQAVDQSASVHQATQEKTEAAAVAATAQATQHQESETVAPPAQPIATPAAAVTGQPATEQAAQQATDSSNVGNTVASLDSSAMPTVPMITEEQLGQMKAYKDRMQIPNDTWKQIVAKRGVASAREMTFQQADELLGALERKEQSLKASNGLNEWGNQAAGVTPPFEVPANQPAGQTTGQQSA